MPAIIPVVQRIIPPRVSHGVTARNSSGRFSTNLILQSETFQTTWSLVNIRAFGAGSVLNATANPITGAATAEQIIEDTTLGQHRIVSGNVSGLSASTPYFASIFAKPDTRTKIGVFFIDSSGTDGCLALFNLSTRQLISTSPSGAGALVATSITAYPNGFLRVGVCATMNNSRTIGSMRVLLVNASDAVSYTGDNTSGLYIWGAMLSQGTQLPPYVGPTLTTALTQEEA
jgi:hypothetical protein